MFIHKLTRLGLDWLWLIQMPGELIGCTVGHDLSFCHWGWHLGSLEVDEWMQVHSGAAGTAKSTVAIDELMHQYLTYCLYVLFWNTKSNALWIIETIRCISIVAVFCFIPIRLGHTRSRLVIWKSSLGWVTTSTWLLCNQTTTGIHFPCVHFNALMESVHTNTQAPLLCESEIATSFICDEFKCVCL